MAFLDNPVNVGVDYEMHRDLTLVVVFWYRNTKRLLVVDSKYTYNG